MTHTQLAGVLFRLGWLHKRDGTDKRAIDRAVKRYQRHFKLKADGIIGHATERSLLDRFCSVPDFATAGNRRCQWSRGKASQGISYAIVGAGGGLPNLSAYRDLVVWALLDVPSICNAKPIYTANSKTADVVMNSHRERPSGTLAWSHLPCNGDTRYEQSYDSAEAWWAREPYCEPHPSYIGLAHVVKHEWGHMLGLPHGGNWLMRPSYDPRACSYGEWETKELLLRYGEPTAPEPPPAPGPVPPSEPADVRIEGTIGGLAYQLVRKPVGF